MQVEADRETLLSAVVAAIGNDGKVVLEDIELPTGWTGSNGTYTSPKGNTYTVDENGKITGGKGENVSPTDNLAVLRAEIQNKSFEEVFKNLDDPIEFNNPEIIFKEIVNGSSVDNLYLVVEYKGEVFNVYLNVEQEYIDSVDYSEVIDSNNYFLVALKKDKIVITGLTENGLADLVQNKKLTIPESVINMGTYTFEPGTTKMTIYLKGRTEEPATTDNYSGTGFEQDWRSTYNTTVVCLGN